MKVNRKCILAVPALIIWAGPALAESDPPVSTGEVYACADIDADRERLACYDEAVGRLEQAEKSGEIRAVSRREVEEVQRDSFGLSLPSLPRLMENRDEVSEVTHPVQSVTMAGDGGVVVQLENEQVWKQIGTKPLYLNSPEGQPATIKRAAFGSFRMTIGNGRTFRVRRVE